MAGNPEGLAKDPIGAHAYAVQRMSANESCRTWHQHGMSQLSPLDGTYWRDQFHLRNDGLVELSEWRDSFATGHEVELSSGLLVFIVLCGRSEYHLSLKRTMTFDEAFAHVILVPESTCCTRILTSGFGQEIMITVPLLIATQVLGGGADMVFRIQSSELSSTSGIKRFDLPLSASIADSARRLFSPVADDPTRCALRDARAWLLMCEILVELKRVNHTKASASIKPGINGRTRLLVERAADLLLNRPSDKHTLKSVARTVGLSRSALAEAFRRNFDTTLNEFLWRERMRRAELLLESTQLSISEIATNVGYEDPSSFTRAFRRFREITPRKLRCGGSLTGRATV